MKDGNPSPALTKQPVREVIMAEVILSIVKPCSVCGCTEFIKSGACRECNKKHQAKYKAQNKEKIQLQGDTYRKANAEKVQKSRDAWAEKNKHRIPEMRKAWRDANPEKMKLFRDAWIAANPEKAKGLSADWRKRNPDSITRHNHNRRARKLASGGKLSSNIVKRLMVLQKRLCPCCGDKLGDNYHLDHILPLALGGANTDENMQLLKAECNLNKSKKHPVDFMQERGFLL
jgi:HNH endonuclease